MNLLQIGIVIFDLQGQAKNTPWRPKMAWRSWSIEKSINKVSQQPQKPLSRSNQIWATTLGKKVKSFEANKVTPVVLSHKAPRKTRVYFNSGTDEIATLFEMTASNIIAVFNITY